MSGKYVTMKLPNGKTTTVHENNAQKFADMGYEMGGRVSSGSQSSIDKYERNNTAGSKWVDNGTNNGSVLFNNPNISGGMVSVNARYADKYFDQGYTLHDRSQSVNRALDSDYHKAHDRANQAIRDGSYNPNFDYSLGSSSSGYAYSTPEREFIAGGGNYSDAINRALEGVSSGFTNMQDYVNSQLQKLEESIKNNDTDMIQKLIEDSKKHGYNLQLPNTNNTQQAQFQAQINQGYNVNQSSIPNNNFIPDNRYSGNTGVSRARSEMSDEDFTSYMSNIYGF